MPTPAWAAGLSTRDWLIDGHPIRGEYLLAKWARLDWNNACVDIGPSIMGNPGPYWHVADPDEDTVHRLYPRLVLTKWQPLVEQAMLEFAAAEVHRAALGEETVVALRARLAADPSRHNPRRPAEP